jgi:lysyl endopeptidase
MKISSFLLVLATFAFPAFGAGSDLRAEPETQPPAAKAQAVSRAVATHVRSITLGAFTPDLAKSAAPANGMAGTPVQVGYPRAVAALENTSAVASMLAWEPLANGGSVAAYSVTTPGAVAVRMGLRIESLPDGAVARFYASRSEDPIEVSAAQLRAGAAVSGTYWSPIVESDTIVMEIEIPPGASATDVRIATPTISHLVASASTTFAMPKAAATCNNDAMCYQGTWALESNAVARIVFTDAGSSFVCTGTLVADKDTATFVPYFLTANHCISTQASASSVQSYWFYRSTACNSGLRGAYTTLAGGATLLYAAQITDTSFLRLNGTPPAGAGYVGWNVATAPALGASVTGLHNPTGDLQKASFGSLSSYSVCTPTSDEQFSCRGTGSASSTFLTVSWRSGITEGGSSGSALFLDNGKYLVGQLYGGDGSCGTASTDYYGRFDIAYTAALYQWLGSGTTPTSPAIVPALNYSDLWWNAAESGWGISITQHNAAMFAAWYVYDGNGSPVWVVMPGGQWISTTAFVGDLYTTTGPSATGAFDPSQVTRTKVGAATLSFASGSQATLSYTVNGASGSKTIVRQPFGPLAGALASNYGDLWWNANESGWGLSINQQYQTLFAVWYSYGANRQPVWYVMSSGAWTSGDTYSGTLYRTSAAPTAFFGSNRFDANAVTRTPVGSLTLRFNGANAAAFLKTQ